MQVISKNWVLGAILLLAAALRIYDITGVPPSLNWDEVSHGYNAYSILQTGKDEWGVSFPTIFRAYGDYKLPVYIYATALSEAIFGLTPFAVRLPSVAAGVLVVLFTYLLTRKLFEDRRRIALLAALFVAIEPWSFFLSRPAFEANLALAFIVSGAYFFLVGLERVRYLPLSAVLLGLSVWTYNSARIFVPLLLVLLVLLYKKEVWVDSLRNRRGSRRVLGVSVVILAFFFVPMFWQLVNPAGQARYGWVGIIDEGAIAQIEQNRVTSDLPPILARLVHNRAAFFAARFAGNYASHFSSNFLFFQGGSQYQQNIPGLGILYPIQIPFLLLGVFFLFKKRSRSSAIILGWLLLGPLASSLTRDAPHTLRAITVLPAPMIISAVGLGSFYLWWSKKVRSKRWVVGNALRVIPWIAYWFLLAVFFSTYLLKYFTEYPHKYSWSWQYGYTWVVNYAKSRYDDYDRIIVTKHYGEPHEFFLFYWPWDPEEYRTDPNKIRFQQSNWFWVDRFSKFYFVNDWDVPKAEDGEWRMESGGLVPTEGRTLLITSPGNYPPGWAFLKTIVFLDGKRAFDIVEKKSEIRNPKSETNPND